MLTRKRLEEALAQLVSEREALVNQLHAFDGAIQFARQLLSEMDNDKAVVEDERSDSSV